MARDFVDYEEALTLAGIAGIRVSTKGVKDISKICLCTLRDLANNGAKFYIERDTERGCKEPRLPIDRGKVIALHNAGWTNKAIALDMGREIQEVDCVIAERAEKKNRYA